MPKHSFVGNSVQTDEFGRHKVHKNIIYFDAQLFESTYYAPLCSVLSFFLSLCLYSLILVLRQCVQQASTRLVIFDNYLFTQCALRFAL